MCISAKFLGITLCNQRDQILRQLPLIRKRKRCLSIAPENLNRVLIHLKALLLADKIGNNHVELFALQFFSRIVGKVLSLGGKTNRERAIVQARDRGQDIRILDKVDGQISCSLLDFGSLLSGGEPPLCREASSMSVVRHLAGMQ